jgi:hypothetical protein
MVLLYGRAGRLTAKNGGFRPGQCSIGLAEHHMPFGGTITVRPLARPAGDGHRRGLGVFLRGIRVLWLVCAVLRALSHCAGIGQYDVATYKAVLKCQVSSDAGGAGVAPRPAPPRVGNPRAG